MVVLVSTKVIFTFYIYLFRLGIFNTLFNLTFSVVLASVSQKSVMCSQAVECEILGEPYF